MNMNNKYIEYNKIVMANRILNRPIIDWTKSTLFFLGLLLDSCFISLLFYLLLGINGINNILNLLIYLHIYILSLSLLILLFSKTIAIWLIRVYQSYAKTETRMRCHFTPSCSEYAILAIKKYGTFYGAYKTHKRLMRCGIYGGIDYP